MSAFDWLDASNPVTWWWSGMTAVSLFNLGAWLVTRRRVLALPDVSPERRRMLLLAGIYVFICAFRAVLPRADVQRICLFDTWFSTVLVGRSVATVAELAFMMQWALLLRTVGANVGSSFAVRAGRIVVPAIVFAECCSWYAVITTNYVGNTFEESTWLVSWVLVGAAFIALRPKLEGRARTLCTVTLPGVAGYIAFMALRDVPMYFTRWRADVAAGKTFFSLSDGLHDLATRWVVTHAYAEWSSEIAWMSLYFSVAVWASIALCWLPLPRGLAPQR